MPVPGRIDAALTYLRHAESVKNPAPSFDGARVESRDLSPAEQRVEDAALKCLADYFECRADFGDDPPRLALGVKEPIPGSPEKVMT